MTPSHKSQREKPSWQYFLEELHEARKALEQVRRELDAHRRLLESILDTVNGDNGDSKGWCDEAYELDCNFEFDQEY